MPKRYTDQMIFRVNENMTRNDYEYLIHHALYNFGYAQENEDQVVDAIMEKLPEEIPSAFYAVASIGFMAAHIAIDEVRIITSIATKESKMCIAFDEATIEDELCDYDEFIYVTRHADKLFIGNPQTTSSLRMMLLQHDDM